MDSLEVIPVLNPTVPSADATSKDACMNRFPGPVCAELDCSNANRVIKATVAMAANNNAVAVARSIALTGMHRRNKVSLD